ncbi:MAG: isoprenoid biosynthesis glyoxalase ElbB [Planctomycetes bacterium]|nr:isoprenoid biosynthesis glyoxalase ElbB [Planctomycetota bacterium]
MSKRIAVILSGCGVKDGSEIHEAVLSLYFLDKYGAQIICAAPNKEQTVVTDHVTGKSISEKRNVLVESARIARGDIKDLKTLSAKDVDGALLPGGFGAALNLSTFAKDGADCSVDSEVARFLKEIHSAKKPIAALCIAPAVIAKLFGADYKVNVTIGNDPGTASALQKMGAVHTNKPVDDIVVDKQNKIITTPCYMLANSIKEVAIGAEKTVKALLELV